MSPTAGRILLTGGSGYVGFAVCRRLIEAGHSVLALSRSEASAKALQDAGAETLRGGLADAETWLPAIGEIDVAIHTACSFGPDMASEDQAFLAALAAYARGRNTPLRLVYTGGCWLYGAIAGRLAVETDPYDPPSAWRWMVDNRDWISGQPGVDAVTIHPAMVWDEAGGALGPFLDAAKTGRAPVLHGHAGIRWPFVHRDDLADMYLKVASARSPSADYNAAGDEVLRVADIARGAGCGLSPVVVDQAALVAERGDWTEGFFLDQGMSSARAGEELGWQPERTLASMLGL